MNKVCRILSIAVALTCLLLVSGCKKATLEASVSEIHIGNDAQTVSFTITSSASWTATPNNSWLTPSPADGSSGTHEIVLSAVPNATEETRSTDLVIKAGRAESEVVLLIKVIQDYQNIRFSVDTLVLPKSGGSGKFTVYSDGPWKAIATSKWITEVSPSSGSGDAEVTVTAAESSLRRYQYSNLLFKSGAYAPYITVALEPQDNQAPEVPELKLPVDGADSVIVLPTFSWNCSDKDGDSLRYTLSISENQSDWIDYVTTDTVYRLLSRLEPSTKYYWKVTADDQNNRENSKTTSPVHSFKTSDKTFYFDLEYLLLKKAKRANAISIIFTGDGYIEEDYQIGGTFISAMEEGIEALFSVEPYKSYSDYFNVYVLAAYSKERGMTILGKQKRNTRYKVTKTQLEESTAVECSSDSVFKLVKTIPGITDELLKNTPVFVMSNENIYAGTCEMYLTGESISIIPVCRLTDPDIHTDYPSILLHEGGGHGFGRLADEYVTYDAAIPQTSQTGWSVEAIITWQAGGAFYNISTSEETSLMMWGELCGKSGYELIKNPQGGCYYQYGVWRSEKSSCMIDNMHYYSAAQRLAIVQRLKSIAGEEFSLEEFMANDTVRKPNVNVTRVEGQRFVPLAPPVLKNRRN